MSSAVMILLGITRNTPPMPLRSRKKLQRKRATPGDLVGEVGVVAALELLAVALGRDRPQDALGVGAG